MTLQNAFHPFSQSVHGHIEYSNHECNINAETFSSSLAEGLGHPFDVSCSKTTECCRDYFKLAAVAVAHNQGIKMLT